MGIVRGERPPEITFDESPERHGYAFALMASVLVASCPLTSQAPRGQRRWRESRRRIASESAASTVVPTMRARSPWLLVAWPHSDDSVRYQRCRRQLDSSSAASSACISGAKIALASSAVRSEARFGSGTLDPLPLADRRGAQDRGWRLCLNLSVAATCRATPVVDMIYAIGHGFIRMARHDLCWDTHAVHRCG